MPNWRDELIEAVKTKAEREAEEAARQKKRVEEAPVTAAAAMKLALDSLRFAHERLREKGQGAELAEGTDAYRLGVGSLQLGIELSRETAVLKVSHVDGKPRE